MLGAALVAAHGVRGPAGWCRMPAACPSVLCKTDDLAGRWQGPGPRVVVVPVSCRPLQKNVHMIEALLVSTGVVALGEMGDKTQLLALLLAARFRRPVPIVLGILVATLANHALAGAVGGWLAAAIGASVLRWIVGLGFLAMAVWMLIPDQIDEDEAVSADRLRFGVFGSTVLLFFVAEMGDKTQIATVALAARYSELAAVVAGTTLGMMLANVPAVLMGDVIARRVSMSLVHRVAAGIFAVLGVLTLIGIDQLI